MSSSEQASHTTYADAYRESMDQPGEVLARRCAGRRLGCRPHQGSRRLCRADLSLVPGCFAQHQLQCPRSARPRRPRRSDRVDLRLPRWYPPRPRTPTPNCSSRSHSSPASLKDQGVVAGDRVIIYMPMIPEAAIAMLACARIGAVHSVVFGGFAAKELATPYRRRRSSGARDGVRRPRTRTNNRVPADGREGSATIRHSRAHTVIVKNREQIPGAASALQVKCRSLVRLGRADRRRHPRPTRCRSPRRIRSTSSTPRERPVSPRASSGTTVAMPLR